MNKIINHCVVCSKILTGRQTQFCSTKCKNKIHQSYDTQKKRALERKLAFINALGGKCSICGYKENLAALSFHHNSGKEFKLDMRSLSNRDHESIEKEISKCDLLCANCHMKIHNPTLDLAKLSIEPTALTTELRARNKETIPNLSTKFNQNLEHCGICTETKLILGISGGIDSRVLLELFYRSGHENVIVAHLNHGVRVEAKQDQEFVRNLAQNYGYEFETKNIKPPQKGNLENELRNIRRKFFFETKQKYEAKFIILGHNADDQAETVILNMVRGSSMAGLGGMSMSENELARPMLNFSRAEIYSYALENQLKWVEDITNKNLTYKRNFVRHRILPLLSELNEEFLNNIYRTSYLARKTNEFIKNEATKILNLDSNDISELRKLDKVIRFEFFASLYEKITGNRENLELKHLLAIEKLIEKTSGTKEIELPGKVIVRRTYSLLEFLPKKEDNIPSTKSKKLVKGKNIFNNWEFEVIKTDSEEKSKEKDTLYISEEKLGELQIRFWKPGDKIEKEGISGTKKLQDLFTDAKIDRDKRKNWPIITENDEIIWVPYLAYKRDIKENKNLIKITVRKEIDEKNQ